MKGSIFEKGKMLDSVLLEVRDATRLKPLVERYEPEGAICCCVGQDEGDFVVAAEKLLGMSVMRLTHATPLPIGVEYTTPHTLGLDRVAAAAGAALEAEEALVVDAGTALTLDIVAHDRFLGGNISPGMRLRFRSLNKFTSRLPLVSPVGEVPEFGHDTQTAIRAGVVNGIVAEIIAAYRSATAQFPSLRLLLTGGDADYLAPLIREHGVNPETEHSLVGRGLERIYIHAIHSSSPVFELKDYEKL